MKETSNYFKLFSDASFKLELRVQPEQRYKKIVDFPPMKVTLMAIHIDPRAKLVFTYDRSGKVFSDSPYFVNSKIRGKNVHLTIVPADYNIPYGVDQNKIYITDPLIFKFKTKWEIDESKCSSRNPCPMLDPNTETENELQEVKINLETGCKDFSGKGCQCDLLAKYDRDSNGANAEYIAGSKVGID